MSTESVHVWGFFDEEGNRRLPDGVAPSMLNVYNHHVRVHRNVAFFGGDVQNLRTTKTIDGWLVATEFETPAHHSAARMWHVIRRPHDEWPDPTLRRSTTALPDPAPVSRQTETTEG